MPYWIAFQKLSTSRNSGFGLGYIPLSEISGYLDEWGYTNIEERLEFIDWVQFIDREYVAMESEKKPSTPTPSAPTPGKNQVIKRPAMPPQRKR